VRRVAKEFGVSAQELWDVARKQRPVGAAILQASGDLLCVLGQAFLRQRYSAILERKLAETNGRFRLLVEGVQDYALFTMDLTGQVTSWNRGAERLLGHVDAEILGKNFSCIFSPEDNKNRVPEQQLRRASQAGRTEDEGWRLRRNGKHFWANVNITALLEDPGQVRGFTVIIKDVTERREIATVLEEAREERGRLQEKFLSHISHELRTPLTAIYFFTTNVLDGLLGELSSGQHEHLALAVDNVRQMAVMVNDLLDITRVDTHKLTVEPQHANVAKLISEALTTCRTNAAAKNINLHFAVTDLPSIWADPARVRQVLINLIDNAVKFTPEGGTITVECHPLAGRDGFLSLSVSDTGCGISPENCEIIFDRLAQLANSAEPSRSGLGLGLFIARDLVSQQGGRIWVESQPGRGSTFFFTLPVFSLAKLCAHVFIEPNLEAPCVTLIAVDVIALEATDQERIQPEIRRALTRCIHAGQDVLLPYMGDKEQVESFFIVAGADQKGFGVIATRIVRELRNLDCGSELKPVISSTTIPVAPGRSRGEHMGEVTALIERSIQTHLLGRERLE